MIGRAFSVAAAVILGLCLSGAGRASAQTASDGVQHVRLAWVDDPSTTITIRWRNSDADAPTGARFRAASSTDWTPVDGQARAVAPGGGDEIELSLTGLEPATAYEYQLALGQGEWSELRSFRTAPPAGGEFRAVFVADTGVSGRLDGLTTGTDQVLQEIAALDPLFVLGGGDYAYADNDVRFTQPAAGIDAWLAMMEPVISQRPLMPTYGNHEVLLEQSLDEWSGRLATPAGVGGSYSFDVAGVHFVSLLAFEGVVTQETLDWLVADLDAATARGVRTIMPFMHRNVHGDGTVHAPSPTLARQLSPVFERYPVDIVLTAHDQSYERTFPLAAGESTSAARHCYTPADGITWIKSSPGGKLSNVTNAFSAYAATPPNAAIATRENGLHHYSVVDVTADAIQVVTYGVTGDGATPVEVDRVTYRESCPPELAFTTPPATVELDAPGTAELDTTLATADAPVELNAGASWAQPTLGEDGTVRVTVDASALPPGRHATVVLASAEGYTPAVLPIVVVIADPNSGPRLVVYSSPDRRESTPLDGARVSGDALIALDQGVGAIDYVQFLLDGVMVRTENDPPFDLGGGVDIARPFDTTDLEDGMHTIEAIVLRSDGVPVSVSARFEIANDRANAVDAAGGTAGQSVSTGSTQAAASAADPTAPVLRSGRRTISAAPVTDWWRNPLTVAAAALLIGVALGLIGRIRTQRATAVTDSESDDFPAAREYETSLAGSRTPVSHGSGGADDHTAADGGRHGRTDLPRR